MAQIQVPSFIQNTNFSPTTPISKKKNSLRILSGISLFLSLFTLGLGIGELMEERHEDCVFGRYDTYHRRRVENCYRRNQLGAGVWCSIVPLLAALVGVCSGQRSTTTDAIRRNYGKPAAAAISMGLLALLEYIYLSDFPSVFRTLQIMLISISILNMVLFIIASSFMCCMAGCCQVSDDATSMGIELTRVGTHPEVNGTTGATTNPAGAPMQTTQLQPQSQSQPTDLPPQYPTIVDENTPSLNVKM